MELLPEHHNRGTGSAVIRDLLVGAVAGLVLMVFRGRRERVPPLDGD
jgi:hypothetical protein